MIERPLHPYTAGLLASTVHGAKRGAVLQPIPGMPPDLTRMPPGCAFAPRCDKATAACTSGEIALEPFGEGRAVRCIHPESDAAARAAE